MVKALILQISVSWTSGHIYMGSYLKLYAIPFIFEPFSISINRLFIHFPSLNRINAMCAIKFDRRFEFYLLITSQISLFGIDFATLICENRIKQLNILMNELELIIIICEHDGCILHWNNQSSWLHANVRKSQTYTHNSSEFAECIWRMGIPFHFEIGRYVFSFSSFQC